MVPIKQQSQLLQTNSVHLCMCGSTLQQAYVFCGQYPYKSSSHSLCVDILSPCLAHTQIHEMYTKIDALAKKTKTS